MDDHLSPLDPVDDLPEPAPRGTVRHSPEPERGLLARIFLDSTDRLRTIWRLLVFGMGLVLINVVLGIVMLVGLLVYVAAHGPMDNSNPALARVRTITDDSNVLILSAVTIVVLMPFYLGWTFGCRKLLDRRSIASMGFVRPRNSWLTVLLGLLTGALPIAIATAVVLAQGGFEWHGTRWTPVLLGSIVPLVFAAFEEEFIFRGYLLQNFLDLRRPVLGLVLSSVLFWLAHSFNEHIWSSPFAALNLFFAGLLLSLAYLASGNIWFPSIMHFAWNYTQGPLLNIPVSGQNIEGIVDLRRVESAPEWLTGGGFGLEGSAVCLLSQILCASLLFWIWRRKRVADAAVELVDFEAVHTPNSVQEPASQLDISKGPVNQ